MCFIAQNGAGEKKVLQTVICDKSSINAVVSERDKSLFSPEMKNTAVVSTSGLLERIYMIRGEKVMLDFDLAMLYGIETKVLKQAVKRNRKRFPPDFIFELSKEEFENLRSQFVTSSWGGIRYMPYAFTEQGIAMLSSVIKSEQAIGMNIAIMRAFVQMRKMIDSNKELSNRIAKLQVQYDKKFVIVFDAIQKLIQGMGQEKPAMGFKLSKIKS